MGCRDDNFLSALVHKNLHGAGDGSAGVNHVVNQHAGAALNVTHNGLGDCVVRNVDVAGLVHEGQGRAVQQGSPVLSHTNTTGVRRNHGHVRQVLNALADVLSQHRNCEEVIQRAVKEALNL